MTPDTTSSHRDPSGDEASELEIPELDRLRAMDEADPLAWARERFRLPSGIIYFDGNSLGPVLEHGREHIQRVVEDQWGRDLIASWNRHGWIDLPTRVGEALAPLLGAAPGQVVACDSVSVNLFKLLACGLKLRPGRHTVLCQADHFPTDLYIAQGLTALLGTPYRVRYVDLDRLESFLAEDPEADDVAVVSMGHVDFRSGRLMNMERLTHAAHRAGALALWDLSHSAGAMPVALDASGVDLAVGCGYKFLNGGPGSPAFLYVAERHVAACVNPLPGWLGHREPFAFARDYEPAAGVERFVCGTPPILALASLDAALEVWQEVDLHALRRKSMALGDELIRRVERYGADLGLRLISPRSARERGSQVSLAHQQGYAVMQALIEAGVVGDFRAPDILRFGLTPLYQRFEDVGIAVAELVRILRTETWREPRFARRSKVT